MRKYHELTTILLQAEDEMRMCNISQSGDSLRDNLDSAYIEKL